MVKSYTLTLTIRPAIAMIELIFALVIMGITLMSAPMLLNISIQSSNTAMQQESIAAASSQLSLILTYPWDEGDTNDTTGYGILDTTSVNNDINSTHRWLNSRAYNKNTPSLTVNTSASAKFGYANDAIPNNDIDDFHNQSNKVTLYNADEISSITDNEGEYLKGTKFDMNSTVIYSDDDHSYTNNFVTFNDPKAAVATTSSIKLVNVTLTDTTGQAEHNQSVSLYAFSCNIGDGYIAPKRVGDATR